MSDFVENLKKGAEKALDNAEVVTKAAIKKTSESINTLKLRYSVKDIEDNISSLYHELGKMLYEEYSQGVELEGEYKEKCDKITDHYSEITILKTKIAELSNKRICPRCDKYTDQEARFCSFCGHSFDE